MIVKETEPASVPWVAIRDIQERSARAMNAHHDLFGDPNHVNMVNAVVAVTRAHAEHWVAIYETARAATARMPAHTEVKFYKVSFAIGQRQKLCDALENLGIPGDMIRYKPATGSISIHVC